MSQLPPYRLPRNVLPRHYDLVFSPDFARAGFDGEAAIEIEVREATDKLVLNAADLEVERGPGGPGR